MLKLRHIVISDNAPKILILGAVHGNEIAGQKAIERFLANVDAGVIKLVAGNVKLVPVCNEKANEQDVRFVEENLNRVMRKWENPDSYEKKLANEITQLIDEADYVLDLHSSHEKGDEPFVFMDYENEGNKKLVDGVEADYVIKNWPGIYEDGGVSYDYSTEKYAQLKGKSGITVECGYHKDERAIEVAYNTIVNTLTNFGFVEGKKFVRDKKIVKMRKVVFKDKEGNLAKQFKHLDPLKKNELIAVYDDGEKVVADRDTFIMIPFHSAGVGQEWFYLGEPE